ncbi:MAG: GNAT family N-acetyltransferase [Hyphomicrobiales bacterium]
MVPHPLHGELVRLRAFEPEDAEHLQRWFTDSEVLYNLTRTYPKPVAAWRDELARAPAASYAGVHLMVETHEGRPIGDVALTPWRPESRCARLGIAIGEPAYRGSGYGTDTMRTICRFGFEMMNLHRIELEVFADNERARHVYEKVGFRTEGVRHEAFFRFGTWTDIVMMGLLEGQLR